MDKSRTHVYMCIEHRLAFVNGRVRAAEAFALTVRGTTPRHIPFHGNALAVGVAFLRERECAWTTCADTGSAIGYTILRCRARRCVSAPIAIVVAPRLVLVNNLKCTGGKQRLSKCT